VKKRRGDVRQKDEGKKKKSCLPCSGTTENMDGANPSPLPVKGELKIKEKGGGGLSEEKRNYATRSSWSTPLGGKGLDCGLTEGEPAQQEEKKSFLLALREGREKKKKKAAFSKKDFRRAREVTDSQYGRGKDEGLSPRSITRESQGRNGKKKASEKKLLRSDTTRL